MNRDRKSTSDNKLVYQLSLSSSSLGLISPSLFVERLKEVITDKVPKVQTFVIYNPKDKGKALVQLNCFCSSSIPDYQLNNLKEEIAFIASTLRNELVHRIEDAKRSVA